LVSCFLVAPLKHNDVPSCLVELNDRTCRRVFHDLTIAIFEAAVF